MAGFWPLSRDMISEPSARMILTTIAVGAPLAAGLTIAVIGCPTFSVFRLYPYCASVLTPEFSKPQVTTFPSASWTSM